MRICHVTDTHLGLTSAKKIKQMVKNLSKEKFDLLVHTGDYSGMIEAAPAVIETVELIREYYNGPFVTVLGNHDYWAEPTIRGYTVNYNSILDCFKQNDVWFMDTDGIYIHRDFPDIKIIGTSGWYQNPNPPTNDKLYLPNNIEGLSINLFLLNLSNKNLDKQLTTLDNSFNIDLDTVVFLSHFPVIKPTEGPGDYKGAFEDFCWSARLGSFIHAQYNCKYFLNGHAHQLHIGKEFRYEPGSDYYNPKYRIWEII